MRMLHRKPEAKVSMWYEKCDTMGILLFMINSGLHELTSNWKNMLIRIFSLNGISDNLFLLSHVVLYLSCLFVPDNKVVTTRVCHRRGRFSKWSHETTNIFSMIRKSAVLVYLLLVRAMSFICCSGNLPCIKRTTAWPVDWASFC